ncbi:MAG: sulfotransferase, partial [Bacteroidota bacterium]|nr:sulfotransferase [Bacteroidota bacterium]
MKFTAVQMIGTQRSGSNLLRLMLNQLPQVSAPHPPHILERFMPLLPMYEDLRLPNHFKNLAADVCELIASNPVAWTGVEPNVNRIISHCKENTLLELTRVLYEEKARSEEATVWICKSMVNIHYAGVLEASLQPLYIFLYRDGRDVALSFQKAVVGEKHIYNIAKQWKEEQDKCLKLQEYLHDERFIAVCYEELIHHPEQELRRICTFLGVVYHDECLQYYHSKEAGNTASSGAMWQHVKEKVLPHNYNKFLTQLAADEIELFEKVAGTTLLQLGYSLYFPNGWQQPLSGEEIEAYSLLNKQLKKEAKQNQAPEDAAKRKRQEALLNRLAAQMKTY